MPRARKQIVLEARLVVVSGAPGSGKTTLAHRLSDELGCPLISRDQIKEGMVLSHGPGFHAAPDDPLNAKAQVAFFTCVQALIAAGVSLVAEAAFQHTVWAKGLAGLTGVSAIRVVRCQADDDEVLRRRRARVQAGNEREAHPDETVLELERRWDAIRVDHPTLDVDTTADYVPGLAEIAEFARS